MGDIIHTMPILGCILIALAAVAYLVALARLRRHETREPAGSWWFGYARDAVNLGGALALCGSLAIAGYAGPRALVLGLALLLAGYVLDWVVGKRLGWQPGTWVLAALVGAAGVGAVLMRGRVDVVVGSLLSFASPR